MLDRKSIEISYLWGIMTKKQKRPKDTNQLAKNIVDTATGEIQDTTSQDEVKSAAAALGKLGGLKGGPARAKMLSAKRRSEIAKVAANARWGRWLASVHRHLTSEALKTNISIMERNNRIKSSMTVVD
jgi:hypothetical protein